MLQITIGIGYSYSAVVNFLCSVQCSVENCIDSLVIIRYRFWLSLLFVIDFYSLVFVSYQGAFFSYRYVEITITNDN